MPFPLHISQHLFDSLSDLSGVWVSVFFRVTQFHILSIFTILILAAWTAVSIWCSSTWVEGAHVHYKFKKFHFILLFFFSPLFLFCCGRIFHFSIWTYYAKRRLTSIDRASNMVLLNYAKWYINERQHCNKFWIIAPISHSSHESETSNDD